MQILASVVMFIINWFVVAFIIMLVAKFVAGMDASFLKALIASLLGGIVTAILYWLFDMYLSVYWWVAGIVIFISYLIVIRFYFESGCLGALIVAILACIIYLLFAWLIVAFLDPFLLF
jgi:hypothetical protein